MNILDSVDSIPALLTLLAALAALLLYVVAEIANAKNRPTKLAADVKGAHVFITGGSEGLGRALAKSFYMRGCIVCIAARDRAKLEAAATFITGDESNRKTRSGANHSSNKLGGRLFTTVADVSNFESIDAALGSATDFAGRAPDIVVANAGACAPGYFDELSPETLAREVQVNYTGTMFTLRAALPRIKAQLHGSGSWRKGQNARFLIISSSGALVHFVGFSNYSATKIAVKALADGLRNELKPDGIDVHVAFPGPIDTPGFLAENLLKPAATREIEDGSALISPENLAEFIIKSMQRGDFAIVNNWFPDRVMLKLANTLTTPRGWVIVDALMSPFLTLLSPLITRSFDAVAFKHHHSSRQPKTKRT